MTPQLPTLSPPVIVYPDSDGKPMADNTKQLDWMTLLYGNLRLHFRERAREVFVGANQLWYPVEGEPETRVAPDVYVVLGRPQGHRGSYKQWEEGGLPLTVTFEIRSPSNDYPDLIETLDFYEEYGVEEYLLYDPETNFFQVHQRQGKANLLRPVRLQSAIYTSERLGGIHFDLSGAELVVRYPDGRPFVPFEVERQRADQAERQLEQTAEQLKLTNERLEQTNERLELTSEQLEQTSERLERTNERLEQTSEQLEQTSERLDRIIELGRKARRGVATAEELAELERLENDG